MTGVTIKPAVWVLVSESYSPRSVMGVFSSFELAQQASDVDEGVAKWERLTDGEWVKWLGPNHDVMAYTAERMTLDMSRR